MKFLWIGTAMIAIAAACQAQDLARGEQVFAKTCATGYCHGVKGQSSGAPRLAGRGFDRGLHRERGDAGNFRHRHAFIFAGLVATGFGGRGGVCGDAEWRRRIPAHGRAKASTETRTHR